MSRFSWRRLNRILHRDIGYAVVGLTLVYGVSGIAVNHAADWNPNYVREQWTESIPPVAAQVRDAMIAEAVAALRLPEGPETTFRPDPYTLQLFYPGMTYSIDLPSGRVLVERVRTRRVLFELNQMHLNTPKRTWTVIADLYAGLLILVALTGLFVLKGKTGITGRGAWLTALGVAVPALYWAVHITMD
jgi:hypothetical protein